MQPDCDRPDKTPLTWNNARHKLNPRKQNEGQEIWKERSGEKWQWGDRESVMTPETGSSAK